MLITRFLSFFFYRFSIYLSFYLAQSNQSVTHAEILQQQYHHTSFSLAGKFKQENKATQKIEKWKYILLKYIQEH